MQTATPQCRVVTLDVALLAAHYQQTLVAQSLSVEAQHQKWQSFRAAVEQTITQYQRHHQSLVLKPTAVIAGATDITDTIQQAMSAAPHALSEDTP
ncbi:TrbI F-type domain-containing protein [Vibrio coralliilyticus]|nr:TrbI F-type domain-containing protein [Vibrio coralliilyticus]